MASSGRRWAQYDETPYRTGGMERVGYDADTQTYYFQQGTQVYEGEPGAEFGGQMRPVGSAPPRETTSYSKPERSAWRQLAPFLLIVCVVLLFLIKYFPLFSVTPFTCPPGLAIYSVTSGDTCWAVADSRGWTVDKLLEANPLIDCNTLRLGSKLCVPPRSA